MATVHEKTIVISEAHLDSFGHVNNARYLELFEQARWDLITERGFGIDVIRAKHDGADDSRRTMKFLRELSPATSCSSAVELCRTSARSGGSSSTSSRRTAASRARRSSRSACSISNARKLIEPTAAGRTRSARVTTSSEALL